MENTTQQPGQDYSKKGYGKRPLWQWILIYVVIAGVVYGLVYYFVIAKQGGYSSSQSQNQDYGQQNTQTQNQPTTGHVTIANMAFTPVSLTIHKGDSVTWTNMDNVSHTVTGDNGGPNSGYLANGQTYSYTFNDIGTFSYHCTPHPYMKATVQVIQ